MSHPHPPFGERWDLPSGEPRRMVVVGGGPAGHRAALELRKLRFSGSVTMVSAEEFPPYDRTLVSKCNLTDPEATIGSMSKPGRYDELGIDLQLGRQVIGIDAANRHIELAGGGQVGYDRLIVAVGGRPVLPRALAAPGVLTVQTFADVAGVRDVLERSRHMVGIGAGFLGGEIAAAATEFGCGVTLVEVSEAPLQLVVGKEVGDRIAALHLERGVEIRCGVWAEKVADFGSWYEIELSDGSRLSCDSVIVAVGMQPSVEWLMPSGIKVDRAIITDSACRTSLPGVLAAGDCAQWWSRRRGTYCHVEHWDSANKHGAVAARAALGLDAVFDPIPFFWSDQYDVKYQWAGYAGKYDAVEISGSGSHDFVARYLDGDRMVGASVANRPRDFAQLCQELRGSVQSSGTDDEEVFSQ